MYVGGGCKFGLLHLEDTICISLFSHNPTWYMDTVKMWLFRT